MCPPGHPCSSNVSPSPTLISGKASSRPSDPIPVLRALREAARSTSRAFASLTKLGSISLPCKIVPHCRSVSIKSFLAGSRLANSRSKSPAPIAGSRTGPSKPTSCCQGSSANSRRSELLKNAPVFLRSGRGTMSRSLVAAWPSSISGSWFLRLAGKGARRTSSAISTIAEMYGSSSATIAVPAITMPILVLWGRLVQLADRLAADHRSIGPTNDGVHP